MKDRRLKSRLFRRAPAFAILLLAFRALLSPAGAQSSALENTKAGVFTASDSSGFRLALPPVRGLSFDDPRSDIPFEGPIQIDQPSAESITLIAEALSWLGAPYLLGGFSKAGVDCSGFLSNVLLSAMPELGPFPRRSDEYADFGKKADKIEPGEILLFALSGSIYHVGLALSDHTFIHSASEGARTGVIISSLWEGNWSARLCGVRSFEAIRLAANSLAPSSLQANSLEQ